MKLTSTERLAVLSLMNGPRPLDSMIRFADAAPVSFAKNLIPGLVRANMLQRVPNPDSAMPIYALNFDSIEVKRLINSTELTPAIA